MTSGLKNASLVALLLAVGSPAFAQAPKITGLVQAWYTQMMDSNLRHNDPYHKDPKAYYDISPHNENGLYIRRIDLKAIGAIGDVGYEVFIDTNISGAPMLQDGYFKYKMPYSIELKVGQFKPLQTLEGPSSSAELMLAERSMLARVFGDPRDRGIAASIGFGDPNAFGGRFHIGAFNGSGKNNDANAQKDIAARLEMNYGKEHSFGAYTLQASTNVADKGTPPVGIFQGADAPERPEILDNKDATSNMGFYYRFQNDTYHAAFEFITGKLGRRYPTIGVTQANREHLDQQFMGYVGTIGYALNSKHRVVLRYDYLNYNYGKKHYGDIDPYQFAGGDYSPAYTETTLGYIYSLAENYRQACIRVNYIMRSKNFLMPDIKRDQTGPQGGDSLVVAFQVAF